MRPRIRTVKPELFIDYDFWRICSDAEDMHIMQGFIGLWCQADREGRFEWKAPELKTQILPYWNGDFEAVLDILEREKLVVKYESDGRYYGFIRTFLDHQRPNNREPESKIPPQPGFVKQAPPAPPEPKKTGRTSAPSGKLGKTQATRVSRSLSQIDPSSGVVLSSVPDLTRASRKTGLSGAFAPNEATIKFAAERRVDWKLELPKFRDHHTAHGKRMVDWQAAFRTWLGNASQWGTQTQGRGRYGSANGQSDLERRLQGMADLRQQHLAEEAASEKE